jgi:hypothetical protein
MFRLATCIDASRLAFSLATDSAKALNKESKSPTEPLRDAHTSHGPASVHALELWFAGML